MATEDLVHHRLTVAGTRGAVQMDVTLEFAAPWTVIFGPSGSGKSSVLRAACGLLPGLQVAFARQAQGEWLALQKTPTPQRGLSYAPQSTAIFPHMTVRENVEFGMRCRGSKDSEFVDAAIELFSLEPLLKRRPRELSGGERQGVSLARAFAVPDVKLMLLDEPFSGIDRRMRDSLLPKMRERLAMLGVPVISVTHDVEETLMLDAEVVRLDEGKVAGRGPARVALAEERLRIGALLDA